MTRSIRRLVGGGIAALALGLFFVFAVAPQVAATSSSRNIQSSLGAGIDLHEGDLGSLMSSTKAVKPKVAATAACTSARQALDAARTRDMAEDKAERSAVESDPNFATTDPTEDTAEKAAMKPLVDAVRTACIFTKPTPSAACTSAFQAMKAAMTADRTEDTAEKATGTDDSAADMTEDKAERAQLGTLWTSVRTACGFTEFRERTETHFFGTTLWHH